MAGLIDLARRIIGPRSAARPFAEQGVGGFRIYRGYLDPGETNYKLIGVQRWKTAADLLANVSIIAAGVRYSLNLISRPTWRFDPPSDKPEAKAHAEFMESVINGIDTNWTRIIRRGGMYRFHGFGIHEWIAKRREEDGRIGIASIESRPQHTIERWDIDANGGVQGVWQRDPMTNEELYLPRRKLLYLVDDTLTDSPDGVGWFRHLAEPANTLKSYLELESMGFERDLAGIPVGRAPLQKLNQLVESGKITREQSNTMIAGLEAFVSLKRKDKNTALILDSTTFKGKTDTGESISSIFEWGVELLTGSQNSIDELGNAIRRLQFDMALIIGAEQLLVGREGEGSRALSEDKSRNLYLTANATLADMAESVDRDLVDPIWQMNGLPEELKPKAKVEDVAFKDAEQIARTLADMANAGAILAPDDPAINDLRDLMGIQHAPPMDLATLNALQGKPDPTKPSPDKELDDERAREAMDREDARAEADRKAGANDNKPGAKKPAAKAAPRSLYVSRKVANSAELIAWAKEQGFATTVPAEELHVTVCFSRAELDWMKVDPAPAALTVPPGGPRVVEPLGDKGAVVLLFRSPELEARHAEILKAGASHDFPSYHCHVTITYAGGDMDLSAVKPFEGAIEFGPELFAELDDDWKDKITEKGAGSDGRDGPFEKYNPNQPRVPAGQPGGGRWSDGGSAGGYREGERDKGETVEVAEVARQYLSDEDIAELQQLIESDESTADQILDKLAPLDQAGSQLPPTIPEGVEPDANFWASREYAGGKDLAGTLDALDEKAASYAGEGGVQQNREAVILIGPPAAGKSTSAEAIAERMGAAIVDPDDAKRLVPEYAGGIGASALHEESSLISGFSRARHMARGDNIVLPVVGGSPRSVTGKIEQLQRAGYNTRLMLVDVHPDVAARRMAGRTLRTGRLISSSYARTIGDGPARTYAALRGQLPNVGFARIDANGPRGSERYVEVQGIRGLRTGSSVFRRSRG